MFSSPICTTSTLVGAGAVEHAEHVSTQNPAAMHVARTMAFTSPCKRGSSMVALRPIPRSRLSFLLRSFFIGQSSPIGNKRVRSARKNLLCARRHMYRLVAAALRMSKEMRAVATSLTTPVWAGGMARGVAFFTPAGAQLTRLKKGQSGFNRPASSWPCWRPKRHF